MSNIITEVSQSVIYCLNLFISFIAHFLASWAMKLLIDGINLFIMSVNGKCNVLIFDSFSFSA